MRFFSKLVFICNICFIVAVVLRLVEMSNSKKGNFDGAIQLQPLESTLVILGYGAVIINCFFVLLCILLLLAGKRKQVFNWIAVINLVFFPVQLYYFFYSNF